MLKDNIFIFAFWEATIRYG